MDRNIKRLAGAAFVAVLFAGCKKDPTAGLAGTAPAEVTTSVGFLTMAVGDSQQVVAVVRDQAGDPLATLPTTAVDSAAVASASTVVSGTPLLNSSFYVKGLAKGSTKLFVTAGASVDTIRVVIS